MSKYEEGSSQGSNQLILIATVINFYLLALKT